MNVNDFDVDAKRNIKVIHVHAIFGIDYSQDNRLGMLGVIDTEQYNRLIFQGRHKDPGRHMEYDIVVLSCAVALLKGLFNIFF